MLMILFSLHSELYCLPADQILELVPMVELKQLPYASAYLAGLMNYRGEVIPVIDLLYVLYAQTTSPKLKTKIIVTEYGEQDETKRIGILVEDISGLVNTEENDVVYAGMEHQERRYFKFLISYEGNLVPCMDTGNLVSYCDCLHHPQD